MNTVKEIVAICDKRIKAMGISRWELQKRAGLSETFFTMALHRNSFPKVESLEALSKELGVPLIDLLGLGETELPDDIKLMESMLLKIPEEDRKMIAMNIENYYKKSLEKNTK